MRRGPTSPWRGRSPSGRTGPALLPEPRPQLPFVSLLSAREDEALDLLLAVEVDDRTEQLALLVRAARVYAESSTDARGALRLVDVTVEAEAGLMLFDRGAHRGRADRDSGAPRLLELHVLRQLRSVVESRLVRRTVQAEDRPFRRCRHLVRDLPDPDFEALLVLLSIGVPWCPVRPAARDHLVSVDLDDLTLGELDALRGADDVVDVELIVVAGADEAADVFAGELFIRHLHPPLDGLEHLLLEQPVPARLVLLQLPDPLRRRSERVVATPDHGLLEGRDRVLADELLAVLEQRRVPAFGAVVDDGDERLPGHVASENDHVRLVVLAAVQALAPARLGPVAAGGDENPHARSTGSSYQRLRSPIFARRRHARDFGSASIRSSSSENWSATPARSSLYAPACLRHASRLRVIVRQRPQSSEQSCAIRPALTVSPSSSPSSRSCRTAIASRTSFSFSSITCSFVSKSSASGIDVSSSSRRPSSGIAWHMRNAPTNTSTWRPCSSSKKSRRSFELSALKETCGS